MTDKEIVMAAKTAEQKTGFGELVRSKLSRGVNSAYGIGFLDGAEMVRDKYRTCINEMLEFIKLQKNAASLGMMEVKTEEPFQVYQERYEMAELMEYKILSLMP